MLISPFRKSVCLLLGLFLLLGGFSAFALADQAVRLHEVGIRYHPAQGELCVTRASQPPEALRMLGIDVTALLDVMEREQIVLISITAGGRQVSLRRHAKPEGIAARDAFQLSAPEKEQFLSLMARQNRFFTATWLEAAPGFALFSTDPDQATGDVVPLHTLALCTLYLDHIYAFQTDIIGRVPNETDTALLLSAASQTLFLGAAEASEPADGETPPPTLAELPPLSGEDAAFTREMSHIPLELTPIPSIVGTTSLRLEGVTSPGVFLRYSVNGNTSSRFRADGDGSFAVTMKGLTPNAVNQIQVVAYSDNETSAIRFPLTVEWLATPLALSQTSGETYESSVTLTGVTLPGATVHLIRNQRSSTVKVGEDGRFSYTLSAKNPGEIKYAVRSLAEGYSRNEIAATLTRRASPEEEAKALKRKAKAVAYDKLLKAPASYQGQITEYQGQVVALGNEGGQPRFLLEVGEGQRILCLCDDLLRIEAGQSLHLLGTLQGGVLAWGGAAVSQAYPVLTLEAILP